MVVCTLIDNECALLLFSQTFFSYCFCMLNDFAKVFERKVWRVQVAHLHNAARALSSPSRCFQLTTNLGKISFVIFDIVIKKTNRMWFTVALVKFHWFGINWHVFIQSECRNCCLYVIRKSRHKQNLENISKYGFSPDLGEKMAAFWACACKLHWTLLSPTRDQPLYGAGRKESSGTGLGDRKRAPFLVLGLAPWYGTIFLFLEQIAPSPAAHARTLLRGFSQMSRRGNGVRNSRNRLCFWPTTQVYGSWNFAYVFRRKLL